MRILVLLFRRSFRAAAAAALLSVIAGVGTTAVLISVQRLVTAPDGRNLGVFLGLVVATLIASTVAQSTLHRLSGRVLTTMTLELTDRILSAPLRTLERVGAARLLAVQTQDVESIAGAVVVLPGLLSGAVIVIASFVFLGVQAPWLLGALLGFLVVAVVVVQMLTARARRGERRARQLADVIFEHIRHSIEGAKELKMSRERRRAFLEDDLTGTATEIERVHVSRAVLLALAASTGRTVLFIAIATVAVVGHRFSVPGATIGMFSFVVLYLGGPLGVVLNSLPQLLRGSVALRNIDELGLSLSPESPAAGASEPAPERGPVAMKLSGVSHSYQHEDGTQFMLGPLDLELRSGETTFIVGGNGSGKSTLVKILVGLYPPESGAIEIGGIPVGDVEREGYRERFTVIFADYFLPDQVRAPGAEPILERLGLAAKVRFDGTFMSSSGLSSGQRRRVALARAILEDRSVYVFDEWASDQDPTHKKMFYETIVPELKAKGKAVVVVTHDDRYFGVADRIVKLEDGQVVSAQGSRVRDAIARPA